MLHCYTIVSYNNYLLKKYGLNSKEALGKLTKLLIILQINFSNNSPAVCILCKQSENCPKQGEINLYPVSINHQVQWFSEALISGFFNSSLIFNCHHIYD